MEKTKFKYYIKKFENWTKNDLLEFTTIYSLTFPSNLKKKEEIVKFILEKYSEKIEDFFNNLQKLEEKKVSINKAKDLLRSRYKLSLEEIEKIKKRHQLLFLIYKHWKDRIDDIIKEISFFAGFEKYKESWWYSFEGEFSLDYPTLKQKEILMTSSWNNKNDKKIRAIITKTSKGVRIKVLKEMGMRFCQQFKFRYLGKENPEDSSHFSLEKLEYYPITYKHIVIEKVDDKKWEIILNFDPFKEKELVEHILFILFEKPVQVDDFSKNKPENIKKIEKTVKTSLSRFRNMKEFINKIEERKTQALKALASKKLPKKEKEKIEKSIKSISWVGIEIKDKPELGITENVSIIEPQTFFREVPAAKDFYEYFLSKIEDLPEKEKISIPFKINGKIVFVKKDGSLIPKKLKLKKHEEDALMLFFGVENEEKK